MGTDRKTDNAQITTVYSMEIFIEQDTFDMPTLDSGLWNILIQMRTLFNFVTYFEG